MGHLGSASKTDIRSISYRTFALSINYYYCIALYCVTFHYKAA